jgi:hypothetical protein
MVIWGRPRHCCVNGTSRSMARRPRGRRRDLLSPRDKSAIRLADREDVELTLAGLHRFIRSSKWVGAGNRYSRDTVRKIQIDVARGQLRSPKQLAQYIAASSILHSADAWSYLGKSISCLMRGDPHRSRHLAYYAELRAALSLLASEGIGIFQNQHFAFNGRNSVSKLQTRLPTHQVVWNCLEYWAQQRRSSDLFARIITPYGRRLDEWFAPLGGTKIVAPQAREWFRQWGFDLKALARDRNARNVSSYRPDGIPSTWIVKASETLEFARNVWAAFDPSANSIFEIIDAHILRLALESAFRGIEPTEGFKSWASTAASYEGLLPEIERYWLRFLTREIDKDDICIFPYSREPSEGEQTSHFGIIARATLLLRVASGSSAELMRRAGLSAGATAFWWASFGQARGLWENKIERETATDLWADIAPLLEEIAAFQAKYQDRDQTFFRAERELGPALIGLGCCERIALWSLVPPA